MAEPETPPFVRIVVVNYDGGSTVLRCLDHLAATDWPSERREVVVVDNASTDASPDRITAAHPGVRLIRSERNLGFAGGNNLALGDLPAAGGAVDHVALVNPDAFVEPGWLAPLVAAVEAHPAIGAATPKLLLAPRFARVELHTEGFEPGPHDGRLLGCSVHGVRDAGGDRWNQSVFGDGFFDEERTPAGGRFRWSGPRAEAWLPLPRDEPSGRGGDPPELELLVAAERTKALRVVTGAGGGDDDAIEATVGPEPRWVTVAPAPHYVDLVNDAGTEVVDGTTARNRGLGEIDDGRFDEPREIPAWTASVALLRADYLRDVGLFDERLFMYYEDFDLAWRGRLRGWRYRYEPRSVARHVRGAITGSRSDLVDVLVHRNALIVTAKNAPAPLVRREFARALRELRQLFAAEVVSPARRRSRPTPATTRRRARALAGALRRLPGALAARRRIGRRATVGRDAVVEEFGAPG